MAVEAVRIVDLEEPVRSQRRPMVLVVDDNAANLAALTELLSTLDVDILPAHSGDHALQQLLQHDVALVLMDVQMPQLDGLSTVELLRQRDRSRHTPVIFFTAMFADEATVRRAYGLGAVDFLVKPFDEEILRAKVTALAGVERQAQARAERQQLEATSEQARAARVLAEQANRAKDDFLSMMSHELRAPLNAILGWAQLLRSQPAHDEAARALDAIVRNARAQSKLIDDLLDLSSMTTAQLTLEPVTVDLYGIARAAVESQRPAATARHITLAVTAEPGMFATRGDPFRLEQAIASLVSNAVKFSGDGGRVAVELERRADKLVVRVRDHGLGIAADFLPFVFERFRQADGGRTRLHGGLGLGLTLARALAELHGGTIHAASDGLGRGATFELRLPATADAPPVMHVVSEPPPPPRTPTPLAGRRVLVVDDEQDARDLMAMVLGSAGATVTVTSSASEALAQLAGGDFDLLLSDIGMPGEDGLSLVRRLRAGETGRTRPLVAVAVSGYTSGRDRAQALQAGFQAHVGKPCEPAALLALLSRLLPAPS